MVFIQKFSALKHITHCLTSQEIKNPMIGSIDWSQRRHPGEKHYLHYPGILLDQINETDSESSHMLCNIFKESLQW